MRKNLLNGLVVALMAISGGHLWFNSLGSMGWAAPLEDSSRGTLRVDVNLVTVEVIAQDKKGNPILGLTREDFK